MAKSKQTVFEQIQSIIHQGNIMRLTMTDKEGHKSVDLSLTQVTVLTIFLAPLMVLGLVLYLIDGHTIELVKQ